MLTLPRLEPDAPWKQRFRAPLMQGIQIALQNPQQGILVSNRSEANQLYAWHVSTGELTQLTRRPEGVGEGFLSPDGKFVYYLEDQKGNETGHYVRLPIVGGQPEDITPALDPYFPLFCSFSGSGNLLAFVAIHGEHFTLYTITVAPDGALQAPVPLRQSTARMRGPLLSYDGRVAIIEDTSDTHSLNYILKAIDTQTGEVLGQLWDGEESSLEAWLASPLPADNRAIVLSNHTGFDHPVLWNPLTKERRDIALELEGEVLPMDWSPDGQSLLLRQSHQAIQRLYIYHLTRHTLSPLQCPSGIYGNTEPRSIFFRDEGEIVVLWENSAHARQILLLSQETGQVKETLFAAEEISAGRDWQSVTFSSSDGAPVQAWLGLPTGAGPFPTIIELHGGPEFAQANAFSPASQCWLDHGFAYLSVNYRGSTGFGTHFQEKIRGQLGHWELQDIVVAHHWLVQQNIAQTTQIFLTGLSYGGYLTLYALGKQPDLWAGGMAGIALADFGILDEEESTIRSYIRLLMGGSFADIPERYRASSALTYVDQVKAPVLILQGRNDSRAPARSVEVYEARMKELKKPIDVYWFDAGHGSSDIEEQIRQQEILLQFVYRNLHIQ